MPDQTTDIDKLKFRDELIIRMVEVQERNAKSNEQQVGIQQLMVAVQEGLKKTVESMNDNFVLHSAKTEDIDKNVVEMKTILFKWIKILGISLLIAVGGTSIVAQFDIPFLRGG